MPTKTCPSCLAPVDPSRDSSCPVCGAELVARRPALRPEAVRTVMNVRDGRFRRPGPAREPKRV